MRSIAGSNTSAFQRENHRMKSKEIRKISKNANISPHFTEKPPNRLPAPWVILYKSKMVRENKIVVSMKKMFL
jgi:hypothetical protein